MYRRSEYVDLKIRIQEPRRFIQVLTGPRQIGKTTMVKDLSQELPIQVTYISADNTGGTDQLWLMQQWERTRMMMKPDQESLLIIDEIQKIHNWSEQVKQLWDEDTMAGRQLKIILTGSASLLLQQGLTESLAGRF
ncbi:MAG TPA: AAA family ATPase, partial [Bacteroidales bacterium]|nr:AAA family ATPase [Bacteroidales bacterium]